MSFAVLNGSELAVESLGEICLLQFSDWWSFFVELWVIYSFTKNFTVKDVCFQNVEIILADGFNKSI